MNAERATRDEPYRHGQKLTPKELEEQIEALALMLAGSQYKLDQLKADFKVVDERIKRKAPEDRYSFWPGSLRYGVPMRVRHALYLCELIKRGQA